MTASYTAEQQTIAPFKKNIGWVSFVAAMFVLNYLTRSAFGPLLSFFEAEFTLSHGDATQLLLYIAAGYALSTLGSAITSSLLQPRILVSIATGMCGVMLIIIAQVNNATTLAILLFILGMCCGQYFNAGLSVLRSLVAPKDWSKAIAIHELGPTLSFIVGPTLAGYIAVHWGWRTAITGLGIACIAGAIAFFAKAKGGTQIPPRIHFTGVYTMVRTPVFWLSSWLFSLSIAGEFAPYSVLALHLHQAFGLTTESASTLLACSRLIPPFAILYGGILTERVGALALLKICLICYTGTMFLLAMPVKEVVIIAMFLQPIAVAFMFPPLFTFMAEMFPLSAQPLLFALATPIGVFLGAGAIARLLGTCGDLAGFDTGFAIMGVFIIVTLPTIPWCLKRPYRQ